MTALHHLLLYLEAKMVQMKVKCKWRMRGPLPTAHRGLRAHTCCPTCCPHPCPTCCPPHLLSHLLSPRLCT